VAWRRRLWLLTKTGRRRSHSTVEKEFEYTVDVTCVSTTKEAGLVVAAYVGNGDAGGLYARIEALEADRVAMRREIAALYEMVAEHRAIVKLSICKV
jgi:hypothetical protein